MSLYKRCHNQAKIGSPKRKHSKTAQNVQREKRTPIGNRRRPPSRLSAQAANMISAYLESDDEQEEAGEDEEAAGGPQLYSPGLLPPPRAGSVVHLMTSSDFGTRLPPAKSRAR